MQGNTIAIISHFSMPIGLCSRVCCGLLLSFMAFPLGNTIVLQGYTLVVNGFFGAEAVVLYNTTRTLCNFVKTLLGTLQNSVWPEYSIAYGKKDFARMRHLHRKILKITIAVSFCAGVGILVLGPIIYKIWTHNAVAFSYSLMGVYVVAIFIESLWTSKFRYSHGHE